MMSVLRSLWMWAATIVLIMVWLPLLAFLRLFERNPVRLRTGRWFRRLGAALVRINPAWRVHVSGWENADPSRPPYVVLSNHLSLVDIPLLSLLPWEMKWIAKAELFRLPIVGWMMRMAGDIPVVRGNRQGARALLAAKNYLLKKCSVMVFPEGTRSRDGLIHPFTDGAFHLAIKTGSPILPIAVDGSQTCLPKGSWKFGEPQDIFVKIFPPISTEELTSKDIGELRERAQKMIVEQVAQWRGVAPDAVLGPPYAGNGNAPG
jgi:1-acyl-sn-glycerol-3-phosphate acyltransferase